MSGRKTGTVIVFVSILAVLAGCNGNGADVPVSELSFTGLALDFGIVEAEGGTRRQSITVTNSGDESVTVTDAVLSDVTSYTLETDALPLTLEPGDTTTVSCDFHPQASGAIEATVTLSAQELDEDAVISLTGEGNYAPVVVSGYYVEVEGNPSHACSGFYVEDGEKNGKPKYTKQHGTVGYLFYFDSSASASVQSRAAAPDPPDPTWVIADSLDITDVSSEAEDYTTNETAPDEPHEGLWWEDTSMSPETGPVISQYMGTPVEVYYGYSDAEGDAESETTFQWYRCDTADGDGTPIDGATEKTYQPGGTDVGKFLKCKVTPKADSGITDGEGVMSSASEQIET